MLLQQQQQQQSSWQQMQQHFLIVIQISAIYGKIINLDQKLHRFMGQSAE